MAVQGNGLSSTTLPSPSSPKLERAYPPDTNQDQILDHTSSERRNLLGLMPRPGLTFPFWYPSLAECPCLAIIELYESAILIIQCCSRQARWTSNLYLIGLIFAETMSISIVDKLWISYESLPLFLPLPQCHFAVVWHSVQANGECCSKGGQLARVRQSNAGNATWFFPQFRGFQDPRNIQRKGGEVNVCCARIRSRPS